MAHFYVRTHSTRTTPRRLEPKPRRVPTHEEIARLAYSYWEARGWKHGSAEQDWLRAERELRQQLNS